MTHHDRPALARQYADALQGKTPFSGAGDGLFVAGERRTGKSQFLCLDLMPELKRRGVLPLYADLLHDKAKAPEDALAEVLAQAVREHLGGVAKFFTEAGIEKISVPGMLSIDLKAIGKTGGMSLYQVLDLLQKQVKKPIALVVDEAQHALTSESGDAAMWSLKSARDQMKTATGAKLMLVMSGSHSDKLSMLLNSKTAPFWGSVVQQLPKLGDDFADAQLAELRTAYPTLSALRGSVARNAFDHVGRRPPFFEIAIKEALAASGAPAHCDAATFEKALLEITQQSAQRDRAGYTAVYLALEPLEQAVLVRLIEQGAAFRPFDALSMAFYAQQLGAKVGAKMGAKVGPSAVQKALDALREHSEQLVWKSQRGQYAVYDQGLLAWHAFLVADMAWPPKG